MSKIVLTDVSSGFQLSKINENFQKIEDELNNKVLYRDAPTGESNQVIKDIDFNGKKLFNLPLPTLSSQAATKQYVDNNSLDVISLAAQVAEDSEAAEEAAAEAAISAEIAASGLSGISSSLASAEAAAANASNSAASALANATSASSSANSAATQATSAATSASAALTYKTNAENSATTASQAATLAAGYLAPVSASSSSSLTIGTGSKTLTVQSNKQFAIGHTVKISQTANPATNSLVGTVTDYNSSTGVMSVSVSSVVGSGTYSDWSIVLSSSASAGGINGPGSAVGSGSLAVWSDTTGTVIDDLTISGILKTTSGVPSAAVAGTDFVIPSGNVSSATTLQSSRLINGTSFNGSANITTSKWGTGRTITIGSSAKSVDGSANISWSLSEIGAQPVDSDLSAIAALSGTSGFLKKTAIDTWSLDTSVYQPLDATLTGLSSFSASSDNLILCSGTDTFTALPVNTFSKSLLNASSATAAKSILEIENSSNIVYYNDFGYVASDMGTGKDFTGFPSWIKRITIKFSDVSLSASGVICIVIGDSGGFETTGYSGGAASTGESDGFSSSFIVARVLASGDIISGTITLERFNTQRWVISSILATSTGIMRWAAGSKQLTGFLDRIRITTVAGTVSFDGNTFINISYE